MAHFVLVKVERVLILRTEFHNTKAIRTLFVYLRMHSKMAFPLKKKAFMKWTEVKVLGELDLSDLR